MNATLPWLDLSVSHDGRVLAFNIGGAVLMVASTADGAPREIFRVTDNLSLRSTAWTQDGSHVLAFRGPAARGSIWSFPTDGGSPEISPLRMRPSEMPAISPDGTQVAFVGGSTTAEIWVMTGLLPSAKTAEAR